LQCFPANCLSRRQEQTKLRTQAKENQMEDDIKKKEEKKENKLPDLKEKKL
jgi:hypothetical protein